MAEKKKRVAKKVVRKKKPVSRKRKKEDMREDYTYDKGRQEEKIARVMEEFKQGKLRSGSKKGRKVKTWRQAIAIALSEAGVNKKKKKKK